MPNRSKRTALILVLFCLLSLGIGVGLGYGLQTGILAGTAVTGNAQGAMDAAPQEAPDSSDALGASRPNYGDEVFMTCPHCQAVNLVPILTPPGGPLCPSCGQRIPR
ncbi:MAG: hypothetical protein GX781_00715 [Clostridiales bacterium]|nr:hypothetical protein [Clostridiales bacterium]